MHEFSIATHIVAQLEALAAAHAMGRITALTVAAGEMRQIVPDALSTAFAAAAGGTAAAGADLVLETVPVVVECRSCGRRYRPADGNYVCESCGTADVAVVEGNELVIRTVEYEEPGAGAETARHGGGKPT